MFVNPFFTVHQEDQFTFFYNYLVNTFNNVNNSIFVIFFVITAICRIRHCPLFTNITLIPSSQVGVPLSLLEIKLVLNWNTSSRPGSLCVFIVSRVKPKKKCMSVSGH